MRHALTMAFLADTRRYAGLGVAGGGRGAPMMIFGGFTSPMMGP